jgi:hypothetical protein
MEIVDAGDGEEVANGRARRKRDGIGSSSGGDDLGVKRCRHGAVRDDGVHVPACSPQTIDEERRRQISVGNQRTTGRRHGDEVISEPFGDGATSDEINDEPVRRGRGRRPRPDDGQPKPGTFGPIDHRRKSIDTNG